jgi:nicotinamidase-related amidase
MTQALLLMDVQNGILERVAADDDYLDRVVATQERAEQGEVIVTKKRVSAFAESDLELILRSHEQMSCRPATGGPHPDSG